MPETTILGGLYIRQLSVWSSAIAPNDMFWKAKRTINIILIMGVLMRELTGESSRIMGAQRPIIRENLSGRTVGSRRVATRTGLSTKSTRAFAARSAANGQLERRAAFCASRSKLWLVPLKKK